MLPALLLAFQGASDRPVLRVGALDGDVRLDGILSEAMWRQADSITGLHQVEPREGAAPIGRTVVRVLASRDVLLIGIVADDPDPGAITAYARERDASLGSQDHIGIVLDTFLDGRSGYIFAVGPLGARYDALVTGQGEDENSDWDAAWEAAAARTPTGWSAELRIPVKSLIFKPGLEAWGFNVQRRIQRHLEVTRWSGPRRDWEFGQTSRAGLLTGLPAFRLGAGVTIRPATTAGARHPGPDTDLEGTVHPSLDATQRLGSNLLGWLTVNTDFAETEVDTRQTNLTRFPLFFPEKRDFFLEGSDIFEFGLGAADAVIPFFSRRIGLFEGREVPIRAGLKLSGRAGQTNLGALVTRTGSDDEAGVGTETLGAVRVRQNVLAESSVGALLTFGDPAGAGNAWTAGLDATFQTSRFRGDKNFLLGVWGLTTDREGLTGRQRAAGFKVDYPNDDWDIVLTYRWIGEGFRPSLGFVPRPATQQIFAGANRTLRPERGAVSEVSFGVRPRLVTDLGGQWESWEADVELLELVLRSGESIELSVSPQGERLTEPFEVEDGVEIPAGEYGFTTASVDLETASRRPLSVRTGWTFGGFYSGTLNELEAGLTWRPSSSVRIGLNGERNVVEIPGYDSFTADLVSGVLRVGFSPDLGLVSFVQYDTDSHSLGTNTRLRWTFHPLGDLFVVYNHNIERLFDLEGRPLGRWRLESNELLVKLKLGFRY